MELVQARTLGEAWLEVARRILERGDEATWGGAATRELAVLTLVVDEPDPDDPVIAELGDPDWLAWMHDNFFLPKPVAELGGADSYATRLFDYEHTGRDQLAWVVQRLRDDPECRDAAITTFQPHTDTTYVPCVSLLDFWLREGSVELLVYAHSLDFGKKAYGNLVELAALQKHVADELGSCPTAGSVGGRAADAQPGEPRPAAPVAGRIVLHVKTAHVYEPELELMRGLTSSATPGA
ncbi:MAG TPA: thymidylate synthase [Gaiellaceae bacterium]|nr:thymidylate synthase [Gaiellaceae bacterium]